MVLVYSSLISFSTFIIFVLHFNLISNCPFQHVQLYEFVSVKLGLRAESEFCLISREKSEGGRILIGEICRTVKGKFANFNHARTQSNNSIVLINFLIFTTQYKRNSAGILYNKNSMTLNIS